MLIFTDAYFKINDWCDFEIIYLELLLYLNHISGPV